MTLTEFLLARIAEDEEAVLVPDWYCTNSARGEGWGSRGDCPLCDRYMFDGTEVATNEAMEGHLGEAHNRRRVLAECEAKRQIVGMHERDRFGFCVECKKPWNRVNRVGVGPERGCPTVRALALPYADHPDYDAAAGFRA